MVDNSWLMENSNAEEGPGWRYKICSSEKCPMYCLQGKKKESDRQLCKKVSL